jgi:membrane-associated protein
MEFMTFLIDLVLHFDKYLSPESIIFKDYIQPLGPWIYVVLFFIIFMETGFVVTPFLPGDSLLFAAGALSALNPQLLNPFTLFLLVAAAAILGDTVNYWIGHYIGPRAFSGKVRFLKKEYLDRTQAFYDKHGGKTIFLARFVPIVRTFAPFVAGIGKMRYGYFISYNFIGGITWTALFILCGYLFGDIPVVKQNFFIVVVAIILISIVPMIIEYLRSRKEASAAGAE